MDYDFDKMIEFGTVAIDQNKEVVNPLYRKLTHQLKKEREKIISNIAIWVTTERNLACFRI